MYNWKFALGLSLIFSISIIISSCDDDPAATTRIIVSLTDSPGDYDAVNVDIQDIEVHASDGNQPDGWVSLGIDNPVIYDLLELTNGTEVILTDTEFPSGRISQMRLILGENNTLQIDDMMIDLTVPSGSESGLKLQINETLLEGVTYEFLLDFDAGKSVVKAGNSGAYNLKPVIRVITEATSGAIEGAVTPIEESIAVYAMQGDDTIAASYAIENVADYLLGGLEPGTYDVVFDPGDITSILTGDTISGVEVILGKVTELDSVMLQ